jgi:hypothetical protein
LCSRNRFIFFGIDFVDMFLADLPYGVLPVSVAPWERKVPADEVTTIMRQADAIQLHQASIFTFYHCPYDTSMFMDCLVSRNFQELQHLYWHKTNQVAQTHVSKYTNAVEGMVMGFFPNGSANLWSMDPDPRKRHNFIDVPSVSTLHKRPDGTAINVTQKPQQIAKWICDHHVPPGGNVMIIGAGAGGDMLGAIDAGCDVSGIERDEEQFVCLQKVLLERQALEIAEIQADADEKLANDAAPASRALMSPGVRSKKSAKASTEEQGGVGVVCSECNVEVEDADEKRVCAFCKEPTPLHPNCSCIHENVVYCTTHYQSIILDRG